MTSEQPQDVPVPSRRKLALKPRDPEAAARLEAERQAQLSAKNPFGAAKPREAVIAEKLGKTEEEVLKEEVSKEKLHLRLSGAQLEEKREAEGAVKEVEEQLEAESDDGKRVELKAELASRQRKLDELMEKFAKVTLETALSGGAPRVSQIRQQQQLQQEQPGMVGGGGGAGSYGQRYAVGGGGAGGSFGGREFNDGGHGGGGRGGGGRGGPRGFTNYQQRGGFADSYQQGADRQGSGGYGRRSGGGGNRLPEWALEDASEAGFYDAPATTSAFIASGAYQGGGGAGGGGSFGGGNSGGGGRGRSGRGGRGGNRSGGFGNGGYDAEPAGAGFSGRGLGGEFEFAEGDSNFGTGQDRF